MKKEFPRRLRFHGFAISIDAFFALILLIGLIGFIGTGALNPGEQVPSIKVSTLGQNMEDTFTSFENTGYLTQQLNPTLDQCKTNAIYEKLEKLLPENTDANIKITRYTPKTEEVDLDACRAAWIAGDSGAFNLCFDTPAESDVFVPYKTLCPETNDVCPTTKCQPEIPANTEVIAGRKMIMQKQAGNRVGALDKCTPSPNNWQLKGSEKEFYPALYFADENTDENVTFILNSTMTDQQDPPQEYGAGNALGCYDPASTPEEQETQVVDVALKAYSGARYPVSVMLVNDRSGSMAGFDMTVKTTSGTAAAGNCSGAACYACTLSNKNTEYANFTNVQDVATMSLNQATINRIDAGSKVFAVVRQGGYTGNCAALNSMVLWVQRPGPVIEKDSGYNLNEDLPVPPAAGDYHALLWDDTTTPDSYSGIYLTQKPTSNSIYNASFSFTTTYSNIGSPMAISENKTYKLNYHISYSGYSGGSYPRFRINRNNGSSYYPNSNGVNCGTAGASSGSCDINVINNNPAGAYAAGGSYQVQGRLNSGSVSFNVTVTYDMESILYETYVPASNSVYGPASFGYTKTYANIGSTVTVPQNRTFKMIYHFSFSGNSSGYYPQYRVRNGGSTVGSVDCPSGASGNCDLNIVSESPSGPDYASNGTYQTQARVNNGNGTYNITTTITYDMESCTNSNCAPTNFDSGTIGNGTCSSIACTNCPKGTDLTGVSTATGVKIADTYTVDANTFTDHQRGIYADVNSITVNATAVCKAGMGFKNPMQGDNNNFYFSLSPVSNNFCFQRLPNGEQLYGTTCSDDMHNYTPAPMQSGDYNILAWSDKDLSYTINWKKERIDVAKYAAKTFLDKAHETGKPGDLFGLTSFSGTSATLNRAMTNDVELVKSSLNALVPSGGTPVAAGINTARNNMGTSDNQRFIILLTDGIANYPSNGSHLSWTTAGGSTISCSSTCDTEDCCRAMGEAIYEANLARTTNSTTVFVIGIAEQEIFSTRMMTTANPDILYVESLKDLAKDSTKYANDCFDLQGNLIADARCGRFYYASDENSLQEIYNLIMQEIGKRIEAVDIEIAVPAGTELLCKSDCLNGIECSYSDADGGTITCSNQTGCTPPDPTNCDGEDEDSWHAISKLVYTSQNVSSPPWEQAFKARIPCDISADACEANDVTFPLTASIINRSSEDVYWEEDLVNDPPKAVCENEDPPSCNMTVPFNYKDLKIVFSDGTLIGGVFSLSMKIGNMGYKAVDFSQRPLRVSFHAGSPGGTRLSPNSPFSGTAPSGFDTAIEYNNNPGVMANELVISSGILYPLGSPQTTSIEIKGIIMDIDEGDIYASIDEADVIKQCPKNDTDYVSCYEPITYYYVIDYATWGK